MDPSLNTPIVIDLGTGYLKVGFSNNPFPAYVLPNCVGRRFLRITEEPSKVHLKDVMISDETLGVEQYLDISLPVVRGVVKYWEDESLIFDYVMQKKLNANPAEHPILIAEALTNTMHSRKKICELLFEEMHIPALQLVPQALLAAYARGTITGVIVDSGDGATHVVPIAENYILNQNVRCIDIAGRALTQHLAKLLTKRGYPLHELLDFETARKIKEELCFVSADLCIDRRIVNETTAYTVPYEIKEDSILKIDRERFEAPEILFSPELGDHICDGIGKVVFDTIMSCPINYRKKFFEMIILSGGTTMFPGFSTRLTYELTDQVVTKILGCEKKRLKDYNINIEDPPSRRFLVYQGGTDLAERSKNKPQVWVLKYDYEEEGVDRVIQRWQTLMS